MSALCAPSVFRAARGDQAAGCGRGLLVSSHDEAVVCMSVCMCAFVAM